MASLDTNQITWDQEGDQDLLLIYHSECTEEHIYGLSNGIEGGSDTFTQVSHYFNDENYSKCITIEKRKFGFFKFQ